MYSIWNDSFSNLEGYSINKDNTDSYQPLMFITKERGLTSKFKIEELDRLTSVYKDEKSFCEELLKYGNKYLKNPNYQKITITHSKNDILYQDDIIYNDKFISQISSEVIEKKLKRKAKEKIELSNSEKLLDFNNYIKKLALNEESRPYLLDPFSLGCDVSLSDKYKLNQFLKDDIAKDKKVVHRGLKSLLREYVYYQLIKEQCIAMEEDILDVEATISNIETKINSNIRSDYKIIRNLVAWENCYLSILKTQLQSTKNNKERTKYSILISEIKTQKLYRNNKISKESLQQFYEEKDIEYDLVGYSSPSIENEKMKELYNEGGIDLVMQEFDIDSIYNDISNYNDAIKLGIIKGKK